MHHRIVDRFHHATLNAAERQRLTWPRLYDAARFTPEPIHGAEWQAGITIDNDKFRVVLDGQPVPLAIAASVSGSWVVRLVDSAAGATERVTGQVRLAPEAE
jgi:hypothetical protein